MNAYALLGSGEFEPWTDAVDRWLLARSGGDGSVLILPTASAPEGDDVFDRWGTMGLEHYRAAGVRAEVVPLKTREDAQDPRLSERVGTASVLYCSGGNPAYLAATLGGTLFWNRVLDGLERGLAYAGCSAGMAALGESAPDSTATDPTSPGFWRPGLGLFPSVFLGPHWDALDRYVPGLRAMVTASIPADGRMLVVDERTAVVGDGRSWSVIGAGRAAVRAGGRWETYRTGSSFHLSLDGREAS